MKRWWIVFAIGCGGSKPAQEPRQPTECEVIGRHVAQVAATFKEPIPASEDVVAEVVWMHCDADAWSGDTRKCFASMFDETGAKDCIGSLSADQHTKVLADLEGRIGHKMRADSPTEAPPPPPPPPPPTASGDPCEGGE